MTAFLEYPRKTSGMEVYLLKELYATYAKQWNEKFKFAGLKKV
jgi:hypothetical protein